MAQSTPRDIKSAFAHVLYEIEMMCFTAGRLADFAATPTEQAAFLESFLVHVRALDEFFVTTPTTRRSDDMAPQDFVPAFQSNPSRHPQISRMHKELAHLSYARKSSSEIRVWEITDFAKPNMESCLRFLVAARQVENLMGFQTNLSRTDRLLQHLREGQAYGFSYQPFGSPSSYPGFEKPLRWTPIRLEAPPGKA